MEDLFLKQSEEKAKAINSSISNLRNYKTLSDLIRSLNPTQQSSFELFMEREINAAKMEGYTLCILNSIVFKTTPEEKLIRLNRKGWIDTDAESENQCKDVKWGKYAYEVRITCKECDTDINGFIVDNTVVHKSVQSCFAESMTSCEGMVKRLGECLVDVAKQNGVTPIDVYVKIEPRGVEQHSYAYFEWSLSGKF